MSILEEYYDDLPQNIKDLIKFENEIISLSSENLEKVLNLCSFYSKEWITIIVRSVVQINYFHYKEYGIIMKNFFDTNQRFDNYDEEGDDFGYYLYALSILKNDNFTDAVSLYISLMSPEVYERKIKENSIWDIIQKDDIQSFVDYITTNDINMNNLYKEKIELAYGKSCNYFDFAAYCGAINILKYGFINDYIKDESQCFSFFVDFAVEGGHEDVIELLISKNYSFKNKYLTAFNYNHNNIGKWLLETFDENKISITLPILAINYVFNSEFFLYSILILKNDINEREISFKATSLMIFSEQNNIEMVKYLISIGADLFLKDYSNKTVIDYAITQEMKELLIKNMKT